MYIWRNNNPLPLTIFILFLSFISITSSLKCYTCVMCPKKQLLRTLSLYRGLVGCEGNNKFCFYAKYSEVRSERVPLYDMGCSDQYRCLKTEYEHYRNKKYARPVCTLCSKDYCNEAVKVFNMKAPKYYVPFVYKNAVSEKDKESFDYKREIQYEYVESKHDGLDDVDISEGGYSGGFWPGVDWSQLWGPLGRPDRDRSDYEGLGGKGKGKGKGDGDDDDGDDDGDGDKEGGGGGGGKHKKGKKGGDDEEGGPGLRIPGNKTFGRKHSTTCAPNFGTAGAMGVKKRGLVGRGVLGVVLRVFWGFYGDVFGVVYY